MSLPFHPAWLRRRASFLVGLTFATLVSVSVRARTISDDDNLREDVLACEDAVAHLFDCCETPPTHLTCNFRYSEVDGNSCEGESSKLVIRPDLTVEESECILAASCEKLRNGVCARALEAKPGRYGEYESDSTRYVPKEPASPAIAVCP